MFCTFENTEPRSYFMPHQPTDKEKQSAAEYNSRVKVFDELKAKYIIGGTGTDTIDDLEKLKNFLKKHYYPVPLTFFTLYDFMQQDEKNEVSFNQDIDQFDQTISENGKFRWDDFNNSVRHIANALTKYRVSSTVKDKLEEMRAAIGSKSGDIHVGLTLQTYKFT
jgi:hypothetical protein